MIDVDLFKPVNDTYGHHTGDEILKMVASVLKACSRNTDICARLGGDEFAVILPHTDRAAAAVVRDRVVERLADATVSSGSRRVGVRASIGIEILPGDAEQAAALTAAADADMYRVKQASRVSHGVSPSPAVAL